MVTYRPKVPQRGPRVTAPKAHRFNVNNCGLAQRRECFCTAHVVGCATIAATVLQHLNSGQVAGFCPARNPLLAQAPSRQFAQLVTLYTLAQMPSPASCCWITSVRM
jgi:hypothetical protein